MGRGWGVDGSTSKCGDYYKHVPIRHINGEVNEGIVGLVTSQWFYQLC